MDGSHTEKKKGDGSMITFTVAECGEYHSMGEYHEGIRTLEEAAAIYRKIPPERMNGIPSIGIRFHAEGTAEEEDIQLDILSGREIDKGIARLIPELSGSAEVEEIIQEMIQRFPEIEVADY